MRIMSGVEILSVAKVVTKHDYNWFIFWFMIAMFCTICILASRSLNGTIKDIICCALGGAALGAIVGVAIMVACVKPIAYENQYKVTISDEVSFIEFNERYEVIEQDGKIYTIRERAEE